MRARNIKPGICSNEDLAELGPYAYILFTGLWMMADKEGRLENRPKKIKALCMPLWDAVTADTVAELLGQMAGRGMLTPYDVDGGHFLEITAWKAHQHPDPREAQSKIPAPPRRGTGEGSTTSEDTLELHREHTVTPVRTRVDSGCIGPLIPDSGGRMGGREAPPSKAPPKPKPAPPPRPPVPRPAAGPNPEPERKQPAREVDSSRGQGPGLTRVTAEDLEPLRASLSRREDLEALKSSLVALAREVRMRPPDDAIVQRTLDAARGASVQEIQDVLVALYKRRKFEAMYSWGFLPVVVAGCFRPQAQVS